MSTSRLMNLNYFNLNLGLTKGVKLNNITLEALKKSSGLYKK